MICYYLNVHFQCQRVNMEMKSVGVMERTELNCQLTFNVNGYYFLCCCHIVRLYHELTSVEIISKYRLSCAHISAIVLSRNICSCRPTLYMYATDLLQNCPAFCTHCMFFFQFIRVVFTSLCPTLN